MINAIIKNKGNTLVLDFPRGIYDIYGKLQSIGIMEPPKQILLTDNGEDEIQVKLYAGNEIGSHLLRVLNEKDSIADANLLSYEVQNASDDIKAELKQNLLHNQYGSMQEVVDSIKQMAYDAGPVKVSFYCPLDGVVDEGDGEPYPVDNRYLKDYQWAIEGAIGQDNATNGQDMADSFHEDDGIRAKLVSAVWSVESYHGKLFGKVKCSLKEELTNAETETLKEWISGQNSDGWGGHFEQIPIDTEDGVLFVSFWNSKDSYSIMDHDELDAYIENQQGQQMGGM